MKNKEFIRKWLDNELTEEERAAFEKTEDYQLVSQLSEALQKFKAPEYPVELELERHYARRAQEKGGPSTVRWLAPLLKVAAILLLVAGFSYWFVTKDPFADQPIKVSAADQEELLLPDSSYVALNKHSTLSYTAKNWSESRKVILAGEAYFRVQKGQQFDVVTDFGKVSVLGTRFNVKTRQNFFEVSCYEGKVAVQNDLSGEIVLERGQQYRIINGKTQERTLSDVSSPSWTENITTFTSIPIIEVLREFERQYDVTVRYHKLDTSRLFTGSFTHEDRLVALKSIAIPLGLEYQVDRDVIILIE